MLKKAMMAAVSLLLFSSAMLSAGDGKITVGDLKCNMQSDPMGVGEDGVFLSWILDSDARNVRQTAYRIQVGSSREALSAGKADKWDSGWVKSSETVYIPYGGDPLESRETCYWRVQVKTNAGKTGWSPVSMWTMALLSENDWKAQWIGLDACAEDEKTEGCTRLAARYFRKDFTASGKDAGEVEKAVLYISGLGMYEAFVNGHHVGDHVHSPVVSDYGKSVNYNTFDVTSLIEPGKENTIGAVVGNGLFFAPRNPGLRHFGYPRLLAQLEITYGDGSVQTVVSDGTWKVSTDGPIRANNYYDGEEYDSRKEIPGWAEPGFSENPSTDMGKRWSAARLVSAPSGKLQAQQNPPIKVMHTVRPVSVRELKPGTYILDMGQNMVGWVKMSGKIPAGQEVRLRFAEILNPDGSLYTANLRTAACTDVVIGNGREFTWKPSFVFHGFRYVEVSGYPGVPDPEDFTGEVIYDSMPFSGSFSTSDTIVNSIYRNATWGIRGNYHGMPTDCPQRDERLGWLGDRTTGAFGESYVFDNNLLYAKWLQDIAETQREDGAVSDVSPNFWQLYNNDVTWPSAYFNVALMLYERYGNLGPIQKHYESMKKWMDFMASDCMSDGIIPNDTYGDWCMPPESPQLIHSQDPARKTDGRLLSTATYYYLLGVMERFAALTGHDADIDAFRSMAATVKEAYNREFMHRSDSGTDVWYGNNTVTANLLSLVYGLVPEGCEESVFGHIVDKTVNDFDGHVSTGVIGICHLMRTLTRYGRADLAWRLATNTDYPSWGYMVRRGATTIWELWNGDTADPAMNSANHVMLLGDLLIWFYEDLAGIKTAPGALAFNSLQMKPYPVEGLDHVDASYDSVRGRIASAWKKTEDGMFEWDVTLPANTSAEIWVPSAEGKAEEVSGKAVFLRSEPGYSVYKVGSGHWNFVSRLP